MQRLFAVDEGVTVRTHVSRVERALSEQDQVPADVLEKARRATVRTFGGRFGDALLDAAGRRRVESYFVGAVRRMVMRSRGAHSRRLRQRYMLASVADDLVSSGRTLRDALDEVERGYSHVVDEEVLQELRSRLSA